MSAFRGMYGMFRADLPLFRFLVFRPLQIARSEPREKLSQQPRGFVYIFDMKDLKRLKSKHAIQRVILLVPSRTQHRHQRSLTLARWLRPPFYLKELLCQHSAECTACLGQTYRYLGFLYYAPF
jgi:hypothetical protein